MAVARYCGHLRARGADLSGVVFQTDCGVGFSGTTWRRANRGFTYWLEEVCGAKHTCIPPRYCNANTRVELIHGLME